MPTMDDATGRQICCQACADVFWQECVKEYVDDAELVRIGEEATRLFYKEQARQQRQAKR